MTWALSNYVLDWLLGSKHNRFILHFWGASAPIPMGDGVRLRVNNSSLIDYVYIKYESGFQSFQVETGILEETTYMLVDKIDGIPVSQLMPTISAKLFGLPLPALPPQQQPLIFPAQTPECTKKPLARAA